MGLLSERLDSSGEGFNMRRSDSDGRRPLDFRDNLGIPKHPTAPELYTPSKAILMQQLMPKEP